MLLHPIFIQASAVQVVYIEIELRARDHPVIEDARGGYVFRSKGVFTDEMPRLSHADSRGGGDDIARFKSWYVGPQEQFDLLHLVATHRFRAR